MLHQQVTRPDLPIVGTGSRRFNSRCAVVLGHVRLKHLGVGAGGGLPARLLLRGIEVVGEVLGVAVADFPAGGETCFCL